MKNITRNKSTATVAFVLMLTVAVTFMASFPVVNSAVVEEETHIYLSAQPNPVGVGQTVGIGVWTYPIPPTSSLRYDHITVTITDPDGVTVTLGPVTSGPLGNWVWQYVPTKTGTYKLQASWPGQTFYNLSPPSPVNVTRLGDTSPEVTLTVQQDPVEPFPDWPLPTEYWTYPINAENRLWACTSGAWLGGGFLGGYNQTGNFNPYTTGPKTAHVLWKFPTSFGGIEGGDFGTVAYASGTMYEGKMMPRIIINGRYYEYGSTQISGAGDRYISDQRLLYCYDLATGEVIWSKDISVSFAQIYEYNSVNQVGLHAYLWRTSGSTWSMYDAFTGNWIMDFENAKSGTRVLESTYTTGEVGKGNILQYMINTQQGWMALWNFTKACDGTTRSSGVITYQSDEERAQFGVYGGQWRPRSTAENDWMRGIEWNVSIPVEDRRMTSFTKISAAHGVGVIRTTAGNNLQMIYGYSLDPENPRKLYGPVNLTSTSTGTLIVGSDTAVLANPTDMKFYGYNLYTGQLKWASDPGTFPWGSITDIGPQIAYDRLYSASYDGLHCYNITDGKELWLFTTGNAGVETPYGTWVPRFNSILIGDGKVYFNTGVWHPMSTYQRGDRVFCVDAFKGKNIWNYSGFYQVQGGPLANGYLVTWNELDQNTYCFNKGPSKTTVSAAPAVIAEDSSVLIAGTVTDQSPASKDTPAIADKFMTPWMEYLHQQRPRPMDAFGVPVVLQAMRSDGSIIDVAMIYSDINGHYEYLWTPPAKDTYKILATFPGSDAYWMSWAETALGVGPAPEAPSEPEPEEAPAYTAIDLAIIAAVVVVAILVLYDIISVRRLRK